MLLAERTAACSTIGCWHHTVCDVVYCG